MGGASCMLEVKGNYSYFYARNGFAFLISGGCSGGVSGMAEKDI